MLRKIRITLAAVMFICITWLFVDFTGTAHSLRWVTWMPKVQLLEAILALHVVIVLVLLVATLALGRIYCSVVCPLGIMQDLFGWLGKKAKKNRYTYSKALSWLRYTMLVIMGVACVAGVGTIVQLLAPYSAFGRIATMLLQPLWKMGNNVLAAVAERYDSYAFYHADTALPNAGIVTAIAVVTLVGLFILAWRNGRTYCNTICPVGTLLS
ncbi:MAG: 4Fe-4S binding protein, partial [Prevotella sp.]|nr:4Fe-4S binding protein [Prevotella sp.]